MKNLPQKTLKALLSIQRNEITEHHIYKTLAIIYGCVALIMAPIFGLLVNDENTWKIGAWVEILWFTTGSIVLFTVLLKNLKGAKKITIGCLIGIAIATIFMKNTALNIYEGPITTKGTMTFEFIEPVLFYDFEVLKFKSTEGEIYEMRETENRSTGWLIEQEYCGENPILLTFLKHKKLLPIISAECLETANLDYGP